LANWSARNLRGSGPKVAIRADPLLPTKSAISFGEWYFWRFDLSRALKVFHVFQNGMVKVFR
jgi:hypothetical protein